MLIAELLAGKLLNEALDLVLEFLDRKKEASETADALRKARTAEDISELGEGWVAEEALAVALYCTLRHQDDFSAGIIAAVNHSGDSDSTGAIAGNILGAYLGDGALSQEWIAPLDTLEGIELMARELDAVAREQGL